MNVHSAPKVQGCVATLMSVGDSLKQVYPFWIRADLPFAWIVLVARTTTLDPWMVFEAAFDFSNIFEHCWKWEVAFEVVDDV